MVLKRAIQHRKPKTRRDGGGGGRKEREECLDGTVRVGSKALVAKDYVSHHSRELPFTACRRWCRRGGPPFQGRP